MTETVLAETKPALSNKLAGTAGGRERGEVERDSRAPTRERGYRGKGRRGWRFKRSSRKRVTPSP